MTDSFSPVQVGEIIAGKYRVERVLGMGGMGVVVAATHVDLEEIRAVKFMLPAALAEKNAVERFLREARAAVRLKSEHVAKVHDVGRLESGAPYIVMEHLEGADLARLIRTESTIAVEEAVLYVLQACEAIAEAHAAGIVHRDLKPANLFLTRTADGSPCIKVLDFGISKLVGPEAANQGPDLTNTTAMIGSPSYMSPEQIRSSRTVDARTDIWSLGVILHQLLTRQLPFHAEGRLEMCMTVVHDPPTLASSVRPDLPLELDALIARCLEKDPTSRFPSVRDLAAALLPFAPLAGARLSVERIERLQAAGSIPPGPRSGSRPGAGAASMLAQTPSHTEASWGTSASHEGAPSRRPWIALAAAAAMIAAVGAGLLLWSSRSPSAAADTAPTEELVVTARTPASPASLGASAPEIAPSPVASAPSPGASADASPSTEPIEVPSSGANTAAASRANPAALGSAPGSRGSARRAPAAATSVAPSATAPATAAPDPFGRSRK